MLSDPSGLIDRIPELEPLCQDGRLRAAVASGDPFRVYRALWWARVTGRLRPHREVLRQLLKNRRLFAKAAGSPFLGTFNSIGASFVDERDQDPQDGTSIATHAVVVIYKMPILPLGAYVVRQEESSGLSSTWRIFARVPLSPLAWLYARAVALAAVLLIGGGVTMGLKASRYHDVWVVNGFNQPLRVFIANKGLTLAARSHGRIADVPLGKQPARATTIDGVEVDALELEVRPRVELVAWNIAGAGVLYREVVVYTTNDRDAAAHPAPPPTIYCGQRQLLLDDVDHLFAPAPKQVSMSQGTRSVERVRLDLVREIEDQVGWCYEHLARANRITETLPALTAQAALKGWPADATLLAAYVQGHTDQAKAVAMLRQARDAHSDEVQYHRVYQDYVRARAPTVDLEVEYAARARAAPTSADAQYLYGRLLRGADGEAAAEALARRFPDHPPALRGVAYTRYMRGDWRGAHEAWERLRSVSPELAAESAEVEVTALAGLDRLQAAVARTRELFAAAAPADRAQFAVLYARVAKLAGDPAPDALIAELEKPIIAESPDFRLWILRARCGLDTRGADAKERAILFSRYVTHEPKKALSVAAAMNEHDVLNIDVATWALGFAEAVVAADAAAEQALARRPQLEPQTLDAVRRFLRGEQASLPDAEVLPSIRSAVYAVRARQEANAPAKRRALLEKARRTDPLHTSVDDAVAAWQL